MLASVTVGSVPAHPVRRPGRAAAPATRGPTRSARVSGGTWAMDPPPAPTGPHVHRGGPHLEVADRGLPPDPRRAGPATSAHVGEVPPMSKVRKSRQPPRRRPRPRRPCCPAGPDRASRPGCRLHSPCRPGRRRCAGCTGRPGDAAVVELARQAGDVAGDLRVDVAVRDGGDGALVLAQLRPAPRWDTRAGRSAGPRAAIRRDPPRVRRRREELMQRANRPAPRRGRAQGAPA